MKIKNVLIQLVVAIIAALIAVFVYSQISPTATGEVSYRERHPTWYTSLPADFDAGQFDFTYAAERTVHGVVNVATTSMRQRGQRGRQDPFFDFFFGPQERERQPEPVQGIGSGVIISEDGYIVTNYHVIENATEIEITLNDRRSFKAEILGSDPNTDIALLKIDGSDFPFIEFGDSDELKLGQWVLAVGNPLNLTSTVTAGIVSAKGRSLPVFQDRDMPITSFIQTDAAVNRGNSGGALVNLRGELIGIPTLIISPTAAYSGNSFAVPVSMVKKVVEDIIEFGEVQRAVLGVQIRDLTASLAREEKIDRLEGVYVAGITSGGAAEDAGIKEGDVILRIDDVPVNSVAELQEQVARYRPKEKVNVLINRNNKTQQIAATLRNPEGQMEIVRPQEAYLGARLRELSRDEIRDLNISNGVQVSQLAPGKFMSAGIQEGFIITSINNTPVNSPSDVRKILDGHQGGVYVEGVYPDGTVAYYAFGL
jgi:serine protease Do